jgi:phage shock protein C
MTTQSPLTRPQDDRLIAGVCAGIARRCGWDTTSVRIGYVLLSLLTTAFPGLLLYIILWVIMPDDPA